MIQKSCFAPGRLELGLLQSRREVVQSIVGKRLPHIWGSGSPLIIAFRVGNFDWIKKSECRKFIVLGQNRNTLLCRMFIMLGQTFLANTKISRSCVLENVGRLRKLKKNSLDVSQTFTTAVSVSFDDLRFLKAPFQQINKSIISYIHIENWKCKRNMNV